MGGLTAERQRRASHEDARATGRSRLPPSLGHPLDPATLSVMNSLFGYDFGRVRIHEGSEASRSARQMNALAFTEGDGIFFGENQYRAGTDEGMRLIAHELTHVVQQSAGSRTAEFSSALMPSEREAGQVEDALAGRASLPRITQMGVGVMRKDGGQTGQQQQQQQQQQPKEDSNVTELKTKVKKLVTEKFGGDYKKAFDHYAKDGSIGPDELKSLLSDAGVGNFATRGAWVSGIIKKLDTNGNGKIEWGEFAAVLG